MPPILSEKFFGLPYLGVVGRVAFPTVVVALVPCRMPSERGLNLVTAMSSTPIRSWSLCSSLVLALALSTATKAQDLTLYDGFDYGVTGAGSGALAGQKGGFGWRRPWLDGRPES